MRAKDIAEWREGYARQLLNIDFRPAEGVRFSANFAPVSQSVRAVRSRFSAGMTFRDAELVRDGDDCASLVVVLSDNADFRQRGQTLRLRKAEATLMPHWHPGELGSETTFECMSIPIPVSELNARMPNCERSALSRISGKSTALRLLNAYCVVLDRDKQKVGADMLKLVQRHVYDLAVRVIADTDLDLGEGSAIESARLAAAKLHIERRFRDPLLSLAAVAAAQGVTPRHLQRVFTQHDLSFSTYVNDLRLEFAHALIIQNSQRMKISEVALLSGFSDISHFNRMFRARFGHAPRSTSRG